MPPPTNSPRRRPRWGHIEPRTPGPGPQVRRQPGPPTAAQKMVSWTAAGCLCVVMIGGTVYLLLRWFT